MSKIIAVPSYKDGLNGLVEQLGQMLPTEKLSIFNNDARQLGQQHRSPLKLQVGDMAPAFSLPNAAGNMLQLQDLLHKGAVVLTFYRGAWCPYCNLQLKHYQQILPQITAAGAQLVAVSPMTPDHSLNMQQSNELRFEVLSDVGNKVARQFTAIIDNPASSIQAMAELGYDFHSFYADKSAELPVPATFVIAKHGAITFAASEGGDYRQRVEPGVILNALDA
jgi:peroxiredoxin